MPTTLPSFEELRSLARHSPAELEALRRELTEAVIARAPRSRQPRLRGLQFQIEHRCRLAPSPLAACVWVSGRMHATFEDLRQALISLRPPPPPPPRCPVIPLRPGDSSALR